MNNINSITVIAAVVCSYSIVRLIHIYEVKERLKRLFNIKDNNKLPVDYDCVHSLLDVHIKRIAKKHDIELTFKINKDLINSCFGECEVDFFGKNSNHEFAFSFFNHIENTKKKTSVAGLTNLATRIASDLEDKLLNFLILDRLISLGDSKNKENSA